MSELDKDYDEGPSKLAIGYTDGTSHYIVFNLYVNEDGIEKWTVTEVPYDE